MTDQTDQLITVVGGVYYEYCTHPNTQDFYGSAGRAASAIAKLNTPVLLHTYADSTLANQINERAAFEKIKVVIEPIDKSIVFVYDHGLAEPRIYSVPEKTSSPLRVEASKVIQFGMLEGSAIIDAEFAVYDPQNVSKPEPFHANGSTAKKLALVLNRYEAAALCASAEHTSPEAQAAYMYQQGLGQVIIIKLGPAGALVYENGKASTVPAYETSRVSKIGSGDMFVAHFGHAWMNEGLSAHDAADKASRATAYYCEKSILPSSKTLSSFSPAAITLSEKFQSDSRPVVYLAGPFFTLTQVWLVDQTRKNLRDLGFKVFSPYHDVGHGSASDVVEKDLDALKEADIVFAIGDGLDAGTIYEVGFARAENIPVIFYSENESEEDKKMMEGSGCVLVDDYVTAIYKTLWTAVKA